MKIALLFSGQIRRINVELFRYGLTNFVKNIDYEIYIYCWEEIGKSMNHNLANVDNFFDKNAINLVNDFFEGFNVKAIQSESYKSFIDNLEYEYNNIFESNSFDKKTIHSLPQIYTMSKSFQLISEDIDSYDLIFRCRFDSLFLHPLYLYDLTKLKKSNMVHSINFGRAFNPNRIYDIFFGGSKNSMRFLGEIWNDLPYLISDNFDNKLDKRDACRLLFISSIKSGYKVNTFETRICEIYRNFSNNYFEKYIISMHLVSLKGLYKNFSSLIYFLKWFRYRNFNLKIALIYLLKTIILLPFSYLKRIKFI